MNKWTTTTLSKACGATPQGINKFLEKQGLKERGVLFGNKRLYDDEVAEIVLSHFNKESVTVSEISETTETVSIPKSETENLVSQLKSEIEFLRSQIKEQDEQIKSLIETNTILSETNKALSAATTINTLSDKKEILLESVNKEEPPRKRTVRDWWRDLWS